MGDTANLSIKVRAHRCDQCTQSHLKCDRVLPHCNNCSKKNLPCTLNRTIIYTKVKGKNKRDISTINKRRTNNVDNNHQFSLVTKTTISKSPKDYGYSYSVLSVFHKFPRKSVLENLTNLIQNPSPFIPNQGISLFLTLTQKLDLLILKPKKELIKPKLPSMIPTNVNNILKQAFDNYFIYNNKILPLFDETEFQFTRKSQSLQMTILVCGLSWMEQTPEIKALMSFFEVKLFTLLSKVHRIKSSLTMIQVVLIAITSLSFFPWVVSIKEILLAHCYRSSFILQLNQAPKWLSRSLKNERAVTYCILHAYYNGILTRFGSYVGEINRPEVLFKLSSNFDEEAMQPDDMFYKNHGQVNYYCFLKLMEFYFELSKIFHYLRLFKEGISAETKSLNFEIYSYQLSKKMTMVKDEYFGWYDDLIIFMDNEEIINKIKQLQYCILFFFHLVHFFLFSFQLSHSKYKHQAEDQHVNNNHCQGPDYVKLSLNECYSIINLSTSLNFGYTLTFSCSQVSICLIFILRYEKNLKLKNESVKKGIKYLENLSKFLSIALISQLNLKLIRVIQEFLKHQV